MWRPFKRFLSLLLPAGLIVGGSAYPADLNQGQALYGRYCHGCHGVGGEGRAFHFMPHVDTLSKQDYMALVPDDYLMLIISKGGEAIGKNPYMPAWESVLDESQRRDLIAYIRTFTQK